MRKTKIICTLGPSVDSEEMLEQLIQNGMDCARLNFSHGTHEEQLVRINRVKKVRDKLGINLPILLDTKGPEIRLRNFEDGKIEVKTGDLITLSSDKDLIGTKHKVGLSFDKLAYNVKVGTKILVDDGKVSLEVQEIIDKDVLCKVLNDGVLKDKKSINIPNVIVEMDYLSENDKKDLLFGIANDIDYIAASFVRTAQDVIDLREFLKANGGEDIKIISKIENTSGIANLGKIIDLSDGIMVARGDMGVEVPFKDLPAIQKDMISRCYKQGKQVITATQMLESMTSNPRPTRAEVSDVANAIYDRTTAIMLSGETAAGKYPIEAVKAMSDIAIASESSINYKNRFYTSNLDLGNGFLSSICNAAVNASFQVDSKAIICGSRYGKTAFQLANYRPECPIIACVLDKKACRQLNLAWNVYPILAEEQNTTDDIFRNNLALALESKIVEKGDVVVLTGSSAIGEKATDTLQLHYIK